MDAVPYTGFAKCSFTFLGLAYKKYRFAALLYVVVVASVGALQNGQGFSLRQVLESEAISKVFFDVWSISELTTSCCIPRE